MDEEIMQRQLEAMARYDLDAMVAFSKENITYGAGYIVPSQTIAARDRQFAVVLNRDGRVAMLITNNELQEAQARSTIRDFRPYDEFTEDPMALLADTLRALGVAQGRIGLELDAMPADRWEDLKKSLPSANWKHGTKAFQHARLVKTPGELDRLRAAATIAELAQAEAHAQVRAGMTEQDLYRIIVDHGLALGAESFVMVQVAAGERSSYSNPTPSARIFRRGDVVKVDVFVSMSGYLSDTGRSIFIGEASKEHREIWARMQEALSALHEQIRPGTHTRDLWDTFVTIFARHGMTPVIRFMGHGLGLSLHEEPFIAADRDAVLEAGMVLAIEPVYRVGDIGYHLEDNVIVTAEGVENMTSRFGPDLIVLDRTG